MCFCHLYHCINNCAGIRTINRTAEQPILPVYRERTDRIFAQIVCETATAIFKIGFGCGAPVLYVNDCFFHSGSFYWMLSVKPRPKSLEDRFFLLETEFFPFFMITRIFLIDGILNTEQTVAVLDSLNSRLGIVKLLAFWYRINKVPAYMSPAGAAFDTRNFIITLISICFQIPLESIQKFSGVISAPCWRIAVKKYWRKPIFTTPEQPHERLAFCTALRFIEYLNPGLIL